MADFANITGNIIGIDAGGEVTAAIVVQSSVSEGVTVSGNVSTGGKGLTGDMGPQGPTGATGATGLQGSTGATGAQGVKGDTGAGVPTGGTTGQILSKNSGTNYDTGWMDASAGTTPDATTLAKGKLQLAGDLGGTAALPLVKRGSAILVAPYGSTLPADYTVQSATNAHVEINLALVAAAAKSTGGTVELLEGTYMLGAPVIPLSNTWLRGSGMWGQTKIVAKTNAAFALLDNYDEYPASAPWSYGMVSDMELDGTNIDRTKSHKCFNSASSFKCQIDRVWAHDSTATGLGTDDFSAGWITRCYVRRCGYVNEKTITAASWSASVITFTTSTVHGYTTGDVRVVAGMIPVYYNGKFVVSSTPTSTTFTVAFTDNSSSFNLSIDPGTATTFGSSSDSIIGHNGIGIASGAALEQATIVSDCICIENQNNNFLIEADQNITGAVASYIYTNCISVRAGNVGFLNTGTPNSQFNDCSDYGSPTGFSAASTIQSRTITAASWSGGTATFTTDTAHGYSATGGPDDVLKKVEIKGMTPSGYNGYYTVTGTPTTTTFTVAVTSDPGTSTVFGTSEYIFHNVYGSTFNDILASHNLNWGVRLPTHSDGVMVKDATVKYSYNRGIGLNSSNTQLSGLRVSHSGRQGIHLATGSGNIVPMKHVDISDSMIWNSGRRGLASNGNGIEIAPTTSGPASIENVTITNVQAWDDQDTKTQTYGVRMTTGGVVANIAISGGDLNGNATAPMLLADTSDQIRITNVGGVNPQGKITLGNITGSTTLDSTTGSYFAGTLTGNITLVMPASLVTGTTITTVFTQDATGGRTLTLPANAASAQSTLVLSTVAGVADTITWVSVNEGTIKWREVSHALSRPTSVAEGGTAATTASAARTNLGLAIGTDVEAHDADLTTIAGLSPTNDDVLQRKAGAWTNRTMAQVKTDLVLVKGDVGLGNVDNTSDASKPISTATQTALDTKVGLTGNETIGGNKTFSGSTTIGATTVTDATDITLGSTTGTKIGTATTQKLAFFNSTPIVRPGNTTDLRVVLTNLGLLASGGATPLNLNGGAFTAASATIGALTGLIKGASGVLSAATAGTDYLAPAAIGVTVQAFDSDLSTIAGLTATTDNFLQAKSSAWASRTPTQVTADLIPFVGDSGAGGTKGLVPAPAIGDATKYLKGNGTWATVSGSGDALVANPLSQFAATTSLQLLGVMSDETGTGALVFATSPTLVTPILGTPTSATLTNATGLPISGLVASTSAALGVGTVELGHATDTTLSRSAAGQLAVEGVDVLTTSNTKTLTNKTIAADGTGNSITNVANLSVKRQNNTTDSTITGVHIETGWGVFAQGAAGNKSETVTFNTAFTTTPIVTISYGGDQTGGTIALGNGGNVEKGPVAIKAYGESTSGFTAHAHTSDGTSWSATANVYYKWTAIGS